MARPSPRAAGETAIPLRFGDDALLWASWLYHEEGMTQGDIAAEMGVSRASVNTYLAEARARGLVTIEIEPRQFRALSLAEALRKRFDLEDCLVVPTNGGERSLNARLGAAGAQALARYARPGDTLAVTWGRTILALVEALRVAPLGDVRVVQATGGTTAKIPWTPEACASRLAEALGGRCIPLSAPAIVSSAAMRDMLFAEPVLAEQMAVLSEANRILFGISSLRPESTIHTSGFLDGPERHDYEQVAIGSIAGRFISASGERVPGPLDGRTIGIDLAALRAVPQRIAVAGGSDKVPAILGALRGGFVSVLVTDTQTGWGILTADGWSEPPRRAAPSPPTSAPIGRTHTKKLLNDPRAAVDEALEGALAAHGDTIALVPGTPRAVRAVHGPRPGKVGVVIGGGSGHEPAFWGYVGPGLADAAVVGNLFAAPPPGPILAGTRAINGGAGVLYVFGNFSGDVMNFEMAAEELASDGIETRSVVTIDDIASAPAEAVGSRRGVAGNVFVFKIAGAAADRMMPLDACEAVTRRAAARTFSMGVALEPGTMPETRRPSFSLGPADMEIGVGVHGEPGVAREPLASADAVADLLVDRLFAEMRLEAGARIAVLVNSLGGTPAMELYVVHRRVAQRLAARRVEVVGAWVGPYYTSLDMAGVSLSFLHCDDELLDLLRHPCRSAAMTVVR
ncbi:bifunctional sugar-binding transcriptional regulator/dihydroxyacetone kinase subunit DhaK [Aureimonas phyllosphaerae]|uniref:Dihydroxyacetone kinase-like protein n=1 Tax=Aureimonas phyllosphaerae TaxID=1166078 RepID=A0A7W6BUA1_9HYPH|nr:bifunctional sugar-binding transcriptional regulator/dihydroxyacetone kinase subunit DhaK [Aureimonas phyllosphaerae]MBB3936410.1 dihydroxyacetone kinase-like protein [Aureimonas phyllosphaerae]MBB3960726.1 dihydroxyacetone kinase-like protein [Aureimonas phyllosphaerae]SFF30806.1 dihydroxyacetone kinase, N-terminal domain [Aureimonas phyllosphaerae]